MIEIFSTILSTYVLTFALGVGLYELCIPSYIRRRFLFLVLAPGMGLLLLSICGAYTVAFSRYIGETLVLSGVIAVAAALAGGALRIRNRAPSPFIAALMPDSLRCITRNEALRGGVFVLALATVLIPIFSDGLATTPFRQGIDQVGYAQTAQYLYEGGTIVQAREALLKSLVTTDLTKAKAQNDKSLDFGLYVSSEFLLKALRWGYPAAIAAITIAIHAGHVFRVEFLVLILSYALLSGLVIAILERCFSFQRNISLACGIALLFNCNLLNVLYEGQLAQIFCLPYFFLFMMIFLESRTWHASSIVEKSVIARDAKSILACALLVGGILSSYNEAMILLIGAVVATEFLDLLFYGTISKRSCATMLAGVIAGFAMMFPIAKQWIEYSVANLRLLGHSGFWQPHWGSLAEIAGLLDMYDPTGYSLVPRTTFNVAVSATLSIAVAIVLVRYLLGKQARYTDRSFWSVPLVLTLVAYLKIRYVDMIINYSYMKIYTVFLPFIVCAVFAAIFSLAPKKRMTSRVVGLAVVCLSTFTGVRYLINYEHQGHYVTSQMFALYRNPGDRLFAHVALVTRDTEIADYMLTPLIATNWVNQSGRQKVLQAAAKTPVYFLAETKHLVSRSLFLKQFKGGALLSTDGFVVVNPQKTVDQFCPSANVPYSVDSLNLQSDDSWKDLPSPQCDIKAYFTTVPGLEPEVP